MGLGITPLGNSPWGLVIDFLAFYTQLSPPVCFSWIILILALLIA